ncbi:MAG: quinone-interacting membrane-bound oxidoreductase complex subunit QmoC [Nitrospinota bacterium]|nr:quinone-interacting membrane-bound oxidoreductase complex subunit QmoC [Nitrospinota bacterium]MDH5756546.1 quinone-interacting membrane-bound oxidoreductase complex subunit QmoC [Nitrospinota bacterium]
MADTQTLTIQPDPAFVKSIMENGGETLKKCFQCGNCSVVCNISPDVSPFPRKEMVWAQWGLSDRLLGNADVWICHGCADCTTHCPRGARPGDVMAALRNISFRRFAGFDFMGDLLAKPSGLFLLLLVPIVWIGGMIAVASKEGFMSMKPIVFSNMMPVPAIDAVFLPAVGLAVVSALLGLSRFWRQLKENSPGLATPPGSIISAALAVIKGIAIHEKMGKCVTNSYRFSSHLMTMYGFFALMATTGLVALMYWINKLQLGSVAATPLALSHPVKILGNIGALLAVSGVTMIVARRYGQDGDKTGSLVYYDSHFIFILYGTILTGIGAETLRLLGLAAPAFGIYYVHLVLVFTLLVYAPFSKFSHLMYRFVAMTYARMGKRERPGGAG